MDLEFNSLVEKNRVPLPDFCLADVTQEVFAAGGMICRKNYRDVEKVLKMFNYKKLQLK